MAADSWRLPALLVIIIVKLNDAPRYAELGVVELGAGDPDWQDLLGTYSGESEMGLGGDSRVRGVVPFPMAGLAMMSYGNTFGPCNNLP